MSPPVVDIGLEQVDEKPVAVLRRGRFALLSNQASLDRRFRSSAEVLGRLPGHLVALFSPQHGPHGKEQDNMIETPHSVDDASGLPVWSLYSETRAPVAAMLDGLDAIVVDLQDVGTRVYTFLWTALYCLEACAERSLELVVLDRPNPIGGLRVEGPRLEPGHESFVGRASMPMAHGLTLAEAILWLRRVRSLDVEVRVVPMQGWRRGMLWSETGRSWVPPSPNLPRLEGVDLYPGCVLLEGTVLSEGRGTTTPFEVLGTPALDPRRMRAALLARDLQRFGVLARLTRFEPTFQKHAGSTCVGAFLHVVDRSRLDAFRAIAEILRVVRELTPGETLWREPPYEYETERSPIDILSGSPALRRAVDASDDLELRRATEIDRDAWWQEVDDVLLYRDR